MLCPSIWSCALVALSSFSSLRSFSTPTKCAPPRPFLPKGERIKLLLDSGAATGALPPNYATDYDVIPTDGAPNYRAANGNIVKNDKGDRLVRLGLQSFDGEVFDADMRFAVMNVRRPIAAAERIVKGGGEIHLRDKDSYILTRSGRHIPVNRENGVFTFEATVRPNRNRPN